MVDNFDIISSLLEFPNNDTFYDLQIIRRGKDHPNLPSANRTIKSYYICEHESLVNLKDEIIKLCELFGARAYINLAPRSKHKVTMMQIAYLATQLYESNLEKIWKAWSTCVGRCKSEKPHWVIDVDTCKDDTLVKQLKSFIEVIAPTDNPKVIATIPTKSGYHIITRPFNVKVFSDAYPNIDIHKNNPTLLYVP